MNLRIDLINIRCYNKNFTCNFLKGLNLLYGPNGCGKTSLMEAVSLFSPAKGIRGAQLSEILAEGADFFEVLLSIDEEQFKINFVSGTQKTTLWRNGRIIRKTQLIEYFGLVWLTQKLILNFWQDAAARRAFIDRICSNFFPDHATTIISYEKIRSNRKKMLEEGGWNATLLQTYNSMLLDYGQKIARNRSAFIDKIAYPLQKIGLSCHIQIEYGEMSRISFEGAHTAKIKILKDGADLVQGSAGEQNLALILFALESARAMDSKNNIILLDDIFSSLDASSQEKIISQLSDFEYVIVSSQWQIESFNKIDVSTSIFDK